LSGSTYNDSNNDDLDAESGGQLSFSTFQKTNIAFPLVDKMIPRVTNNEDVPINAHMLTFTELFLDPHAKRFDCDGAKNGERRNNQLLYLNERSGINYIALTNATYIHTKVDKPR
jgi:hypothetical protein